MAGRRVMGRRGALAVLTATGMALVGVGLSGPAAASDANGISISLVEAQVSITATLSASLSGSDGMTSCAASESVSIPLGGSLQPCDFSLTAGFFSSASATISLTDVTATNAAGQALVLDDATFTVTDPAVGPESLSGGGDAWQSSLDYSGSGYTLQLALQPVLFSTVASALALPCTVMGTSGDDVLTGTAGDDVICGGAGDDVLVAGSGNDVLRGGPGDDVLKGSLTSVALVGGRGADTFIGGRGTSVRTAKENPNHVYTGGGLLQEVT